jgi:pimeloyl-ACP methyl ester carboxylesterase
MFTNTMMNSWIGWREQIYLLAELGYRVIVPSLRGFGGTVSFYIFNFSCKIFKKEFHKM